MTAGTNPGLIFLVIFGLFVFLWLAYKVIAFMENVQRSADERQRMEATEYVRDFRENILMIKPVKPEPPSVPAGVVIGELEINSKAVCPICKQGLGEEDKSSCRVCKTEHHLACLRTMAKGYDAPCSTYGCRGKIPIGGVHV